ncbi:MAG TPA: hypothetical protein VLT13_09060 [Bacteroidota bacterium]|nr:hypothetical protein [Bacteroidota bacterium]
MPLGMLSSWTGAKVFGLSELGLRMVSTLWAGVAVVMMWRAGRILRIPWLPCLLACHPFLWYYGGEARPYAMVIAMSAGVLYALAGIAEPSGTERRRGVFALLLFGPLMCAVHITAVLPFAVTFVVAAYLLHRVDWRPRRLDWLAIGVSGCALLALGSYYIWMLSRDVTLLNTGLLKAGPKTSLFAVYELLGFMGFGPGRFKLRALALEGGMGALGGGYLRPTAVGAMLLTVLYFAIAFRLMRRARLHGQRDVRFAALAATVVVISGVLSYLLSLVVGYPFWGRHLAGFLPFVVAVIAIGAEAPPPMKTTTPRAVGLLLCGTLLASSLLVRFHPEHSRDDYRGAARIARETLRLEKTVWWSASDACIDYYRVTVCDDEEHAADCVVNTTNRTADDLEAMPRPDLVIVSKPDLFDTAGGLTEYLSHHRFVPREHLIAFEIFEPEVDYLSQNRARRFDATAPR